MTPQELHDAQRMSLILQRDDYVERIAKINEQLEELKKEYEDSRYLL